MRGQFITSGKEERDIRTRLRVLLILASVLFGFLLLRLWTLQIHGGTDYRLRSERNRTLFLEVKALRGRIYDRAGRELAGNRAAFDLFVNREAAGSALRESLDWLASTLRIDPAELTKRVEGAAERGREILLVADLTWPQVVEIEARARDLPGFEIRHVFVREYPHGSLAAHVLGHLGEITDREIAAERFAYRYRPGDLVGKLGVERQEEVRLKGVDGGELVEVDALGQGRSVRDRVDSIAGDEVYLAIDLDLQQAAEEALGEYAGAVIAMDPRNGEVLALVSRPAFDPNAFARGLPRATWEQITGDPMKPLQNRAIAGLYAPGSTFKPFVALAGLESGRITLASAARCKGELPFGDRAWRCWKEHGHGRVQLHRAIAESCDVFFYLAGLNTGIDLIAETAERLGLGRRTGIELLGERAGLVPTREWKQKVYGVPWVEGETLSVAIGQSFVSVTPAQLMVAYATLVNGGRLFRPRIVSRVVSTDGRRVVDYPSEQLYAVELDEASAALVRDGLKGVVNDPTGTGWRARLKGVEAGGKTGTAQVVRMTERLKPGQEESVPYLHRDHAWFVGLLPADDPHLVVVVLVEHAGQGGGTVAAPMARAVFERYMATRGAAAL
ncbi:MAG: penicillin-binding protein 2 [Nitrospirae bacterium]|nr:penicillin-binding protein 2 [Nitrospirota bacterium]